VMTMTDKIKISAPIASSINGRNVRQKKEIDNTWKKYKKALDGFKFNEALISIWNLISFCDRYIEKEKPWEESKSASWRKKEVLRDLLFAISNVAEMLKPFLPETAEKILKQIKTKKREILFPRLGFR